MVLKFLRESIRWAKFGHLDLAIIIRIKKAIGSETLAFSAHNFKIKLKSNLEH